MKVEIAAELVPSKKTEPIPPSVPNKVFNKMQEVDKNMIWILDINI